MNGFYINLESRSDRKKHIESNILTLPFFSNLERMNAISHKEGRIGCSMSHIQCLKELQKLKDDYFLIIEDDLEIKSSDNFTQFIQDFEKIKDQDWNIIVLGGTVCHCTLSHLQNFHNLYFSYATTGYIVKKTYIPQLLENFEKSCQNLIDRFDKEYYIDVYWNKLQVKGGWYIHSKSFISQLHGYSDTENKETNFDRLFAIYYLKIMDRIIKINATV